jgi:hypothetical protein
MRRTDERRARPAPTTIEGWEDLAREILEDVRRIEEQLGSRNVEIGGVRLTERDYWEWRQRAVYAVNARKREYERAKIEAARLRAVERERFLGGELDEPGELLRGLFILATRWAKVGVAEPDDEERLLLERARAYVERATGAAALHRPAG